jgi:hypothetical protein
LRISWEGPYLKLILHQYGLLTVVPKADIKQISKFETRVISGKLIYLLNMLYIMKRAVIAVRGVEEGIYRKFRAKTAEESMKVGDALTEAMGRWVKEKEENKIKPDPRNFLKMEGVIKTKKKVRWSEEVDEILYGRKK